MKARDPETAQEWLEAVDGAAFLLALDDCRMYGLIEGGPEVNRGRCLEILKRGEARGVTPPLPIPVKMSNE